MTGTLVRSIGALATLTCLSGCGGGGGGPAASTPPTTTVPSTRSSTFSGTSSITANGTCNSTRHTFDAGTGTVTILLSQASATPVGVQQCPASAVNHANECGIPPFARVAVGASVSATLRGERSQYLTVVPNTCDQADRVPTEVTYTVTVTYPG